MYSNPLAISRACPNIILIASTLRGWSAGIKPGIRRSLVGSSPKQQHVWNSLYYYFILYTIQISSLILQGICMIGFQTVVQLFKV